MSKKYCQHCNFANEVVDSLLKFCGNCGNPFASTIASEIKIGIPVKRKVIAHQKPFDEELEEYIEEDNDENNYYEDRPRRIKFDPIEIESDIPARQTEKIASLATSTAPKENFSRPKLKKMNKKQIAEDFAREVTKKGSQELKFGNE